MQVTFYGVRGSTPAPGPTTVRYGGNTSCVHLRLNSGQNVVLDAGTGIRMLGNRLADADEPILLLLSHGHWDHIQGYPFFAPIYQPGREIVICQGVEGNAASLQTLIRQMDGSSFPVHAKELPSQVSTIQEVQTFLDNQAFRTRRLNLNHPGGGYAYRIEEDGVSIAYITDNELEPPNVPQTSYPDWVDFCRDVDLLIHDAQYTSEDMPAKHGWGHSLISQVQQLASEAHVKNVAFYHHDPDRSDSDLDEISTGTAGYFQTAGGLVTPWVAAEGLSLDIRRRQDPNVNTVQQV